LSLCALACSSNETPNQSRPDDDDVSTPVPGPLDPPSDEQPGAPAAPLPPATPPRTPIEELARAEFEDLLSRTCGQCHSADSSVVRGGIDYIDNLDELIATNRIVPGDPEASLIYQRIDRGEMPPPGVEPRVTPDELEAMGRFISRLRPVAPEACDSQFIGFDDIYSRIQVDLFRQEARDRPFQRYVGLTNRYNAGVCSSDLEGERQALGKVLNSLSTESRISRPEAIDPDRVVYRIDIRDYGWDRAIDVDGATFDDGWEAIVAASAFAVELEGDEIDTIKDESGTTIPYLFSDALIEQASVGELYYALIDVPETKDELLAALQIDIQDNFDRAIAVRAGFTDSAISRQDRVVERHPQGLGGNRVFWDSFDFGAGGNGESIFVDPFDFNEGGSQSLFSLNNGLHGYVIFDDAGRRQAETNLLFDSQQNDFVVRSAVSCMSCHAQGLLGFRDEVRGFALDNPLELNADELELLREVYPSADEMDDILESDRRFYRGALDRAGVPAGTRTDPVSDSFLRFQRDVKLEVAAGDVHFPRALFERENNRFDPALRGLKSGFAVDRDDWAALYTDTLCVVQVAARNRPLAELCADVDLR
jgi:hypothetical protein